MVQEYQLELIHNILFSPNFIWTKFLYKNKEVMNNEEDFNCDSS